MKTDIGHIAKTLYSQSCEHLALMRNNLLGALVKQLKLLWQVTSQVIKSGLCIVLWPVLMPVAFDARCSLGPLVNKVKEFQVETIVDTLCCNMVSDKEQLRDISSIGEGLLLISRDKMGMSVWVLGLGVLFNLQMCDIAIWWVGVRGLLFCCCFVFKYVLN